MSNTSSRIRVRQTQPADIDAIHELSRVVYPHDEPWLPTQLRSHLEVFPEGQLVAIDLHTRALVGAAASLIVNWDDYDLLDNYRTFTADFTFQNHNPQGRTLYAAEVMVDPRIRRQGIGRRLYKARRDLVRRLNLSRIRAGARLRNYGAYANNFNVEEYVIRVVRGELDDPTLSFQLRQGFNVIGIVENYLRRDPESLGYAAVIEWINRQAIRPEEPVKRDPRFRKPRRPRTQ